MALSEQDQLKILDEIEKTIKQSIPHVKEVNSDKLGVKIENGNIVALSITKLDAYFRKEFFKLPDSIVKLPHLKELRLKNMQLQHLPYPLRDFKALEILDLRGNNLYTPHDGYMPYTYMPHIRTKKLIGIMYIKPLRVLDLTYNKLNELPYDMSNLKNLEVLYLGINKIKDLGSISRLRNLRKLDISANDLDTIPKFIFNMQSLEVLIIKQNKIYKIPPEVVNLSNLQVLNLRETGLTKVPDFLGKLTNIKVLNLRQNKLTTLPDSLSRLTNIKSLNLNFNEFKSFPTCLWPCKNITELYFKENPWEGDWKDIAKFTISTILDMARQRHPIVIVIYTSDDERAIMQDAIKKSAEYLRSREEIEDIYTTVDSNQKESHLLLFFATKNSISNEKCINDLKSWILSNKAIIPIKSTDITWEELKNIDLGADFNLSAKLGFEFNLDDIEKFNETLYTHIQKYKREINLFEPVKMSLLEPWNDIKEVSKKFLDSKEFKEKFNQNIDHYRKLYNEYRDGELSASEYLLNYIKSINTSS